MMIYFFLILIGWLCGLYCLGHLLFLPFQKKFSPNFFEQVFRNIFLGYIILVTVHAIISTTFKTIHLGYLILLGFAWFELNKIPFTSLKGKPLFKLSYLLYALVFIVTIFTLNWWMIYNPQGYLPFYYNDDDYILYGKMAATIGNLGQENGFNILNTLTNYYSNPQPYHFFDLWGASFLYEYFSINPYIALKLTIYPTFYFLILIGLLSLYPKPGLKAIGVILLASLSGGLYIFFLQDLSFFQQLNQFPIFILTPSDYKLTYFYVFFLGAYLLIIKTKNHELATICLLGLPLANIITLPSVFGSLMGIVLIFFFKKAFKSIAYLFVIGVFIVAFYKLFPRQVTGIDPIIFLTDFFKFEDLKILNNIFIGSIAMLVFLYGIIGVIYLLVSLSSKKPIVFKGNPVSIFVIVCVGVSIISRLVTYKDFEAYQLFENTSAPLINLSWSIFLIVFFKQNIPVINKALVCFFCLLLLTGGFYKIFLTGKQHHWPLHSNIYLKKVEEVLTNNALIGSIKSSSQMQHMTFKLNARYPLGNYLLLFNKNAYSINLSDLRTPVDSSSAINYYRSQKAIQEGYFYYYCQRKDNLLLSEGEIILKFIEEYNIKHLIVSPMAVIPVSLKNKIKSRLTDPLSKEHFITLW